MVFWHLFSLPKSLFLSFLFDCDRPHCPEPSAIRPEPRISHDLLNLLTMKDLLKILEKPKVLKGSRANILAQMAAICYLPCLAMVWWGVFTGDINRWYKGRGNSEVRNWPWKNNQAQRGGRPTRSACGWFATLSLRARFARSSGTEISINANSAPGRRRLNSRRWAPVRKDKTEC